MIRSLSKPTLEKFVEAKNLYTMKWVIYIRLFRTELMEIAQSRHDLILISLLNKLETVLWKKSLFAIKEVEVISTVKKIINQYNSTTSQLTSPFSVTAEKDGKSLKISVREKDEYNTYYIAKYKRCQPIVYNIPHDFEEDISSFEGEKFETIDFEGFMGAFISMLVETKEMARYQSAMRKSFKVIRNLGIKYNHIPLSIVTSFIIENIDKFGNIEIDELLIAIADMESYLIDFRIEPEQAVRSIEENLSFIGLTETRLSQEEIIEIFDDKMEGRTVSSFTLGNYPAVTIVY